MKSPLLILAACFALGILVARPLNLGFRDISVLLAAASACLLLGLISLRRDWISVSACLVLAGFIITGIAAAVSFQFRFLPNDIHNLAGWGLNLKQSVETEGVIASNPIRGPESLRFDLECRRVEFGNRWRNVQGKVQIRLFVPAKNQSWAAVEALDFHYGDLIRVPVRYEKPWVYRNPGSFDFRWWLQAINDISWEGRIKSPLVVQKLSASQSSAFSMLVQNVRARLLRGIDRLYPSWSPEGRVGAVLKAVLLGDRSSLDSDTVENFRQSGLYHLLVISGLHVGLLASVLLFFLYLFHVGESWRAVSLLIFLGTYSLLVEQRAPTLRASLMIAAYLLARYLYRDRAALNAVGLAALILLFHRPAWLFEAGFDLSFSAALLIAGLAIPILGRATVPYGRALFKLGNVDRDTNLDPRMAQFRLDLRLVAGWLKAKMSSLDRHPVLCEQLVVTPVRIFLWVMELVLFSAILQVGLLMPMAETFHRITIVGIGLNALAVPLMTLLIALAVPTVILAATFPMLAIFPAKCLFWITSALLALTEFRGEPLWMSYRIPGPPLWVAVGFALAVIAIPLTLNRNRVFLLASSAVFILFACLVAFYPFPPKVSSGAFEVTALDCGRGQAIFSVLPDGTSVLVDAGGQEHFGPDIGRWNPGEEIVSPYLWSRGIKEIDIVVLGEGSNENVNAMEAILRNFRVRELWRDPGISGPDDLSLMRVAQERGVGIRDIAKGDNDGAGQSDIQMIWPRPIPDNLRLPFSDRSPVLRIMSKYGSVLLRGDTDERVERLLAESGIELSSDVLESARPLSEIRSQEQFLALVNPKVVLDASGNRADKEKEIALPSDSWGLTNMPVFTTARDGAVTIDLSKSSVTVRCYGSSRGFNWRREASLTWRSSGL
jgi:competence protein ComEC